MSTEPARTFPLLVTLAAMLLSACGGSGSATVAPASTGTPPARSSTAGEPAAATRSAGPVRLRVRALKLRLVDRRRAVARPGGTSDVRRLTTTVRYPEAADGARRGPYPLIVFAHGFAQLPSRYAPLLRTWTRAGYVVAAPEFPGESARAPGGPNRADLVNQPADMRFAITMLLRASAAGDGPLSGLIDRRRIAVAGHSDGGDTALAVAYDRRYRDPRVGAALILAGAPMSAAPFAFPSSGPPLLAVQGTADAINPPAATDEFYARARPTKMRLLLLGGDHFRPYTGAPPFAGIVERVTTAFLARYVADSPVSLRRIAMLGRRSGLSQLRINR